MPSTPDFALVVAVELGASVDVLEAAPFPPPYKVCVETPLLLVFAVPFTLPLVFVARLELADVTTAGNAVTPGTVPVNVALCDEYAASTLDGIGARVALYLLHCSTFIEDRKESDSCVVSPNARSHHLQLRAC
jgi:hypothetical protein